MMANFHRAVCQQDKAQLQKPQTVVGKYFKEKLSASTVVPLTVRSSNVLFSFFKQKWKWIRIYVLNFYQVIGHQNLTLWGWVQLSQQICGEQSYLSQQSHRRQVSMQAWRQAWGLWAVRFPSWLYCGKEEPFSCKLWWNNLLYCTTYKKCLFCVWKTQIRITF